jgi:hypothetical protein
LGDVPLGADRGGELAVAAEAGVEAAVGVVADDAEILLAANDGRADLDDAAGASSASPRPSSTEPAKSTVCLPSPLKEVSRLPSAR